MKKTQIILLLLAVIVLIVKIISYSYNESSDFVFYANKLMFTVLTMNYIYYSIQEKNTKYKVLLVLTSIIGTIGLLIDNSSILNTFYIIGSIFFIFYFKRKSKLID